MIFTNDETYNAVYEELLKQLSDWVFNLYNSMQDATKDGHVFSEEYLLELAKNEVVINAPHIIFLLMRNTIVFPKFRDNDPDFPVALLSTDTVKALAKKAADYPVIYGGFIPETGSIHT